MFAPHYENYFRDTIAFALSLLPILTLFGLSAAAWTERVKRLRTPSATPEPSHRLVLQRSRIRPS